MCPAASEAHHEAMNAALTYELVKQHHQDMIDAADRINLIRRARKARRARRLLHR